MTLSLAEQLYMRHAWWLVVLFLFVMQWPFLQADPLVALSHSRDAFTDEGLNTSQVRNWANHGDWNFWECDNLIKNPLFNALLALPFKVFGTSWLTARLTVLFSVLCLLLYAGSINPMRSVMPVFVVIVFTQFHAFHYSHFSMAEMVAVAAVIAAIASWVWYATHPSEIKRNRWLWVSLLFATAAWWLKVQFAYLVFLIPVSTLLLWLFSAHHRKRGKNLLFSSLLLMAAAGLTVLIYILVWYLPNREAWLYIMHDQASGRFPHWKYLGVIGKFNFLQYFNQPAVLPLFFSFILSVPVCFWLLVKQKKPAFQTLIIISAVWVLLEMHKIFIHHVPGRYLVSAFVSMGLFAVLVWSEFFRRMFLQYHHPDVKNKRTAQWWMYFSAVLLLTLFYNQGISYNRSLKERTYVIHEISSYIQRSLPDHSVALGAWSPSLTWGTKIRAVPVWNEFLNYKNILETFRPRIIFSETEEQDSNGAFSADGIILTELADSVKNYTVGKWPVNLYWINSEKMNQMIQHRKTIHEKL